MKIGNSRGVRIPKPLLEQAGLEDEVELTVVDGEIRISAAPEPETGIVFVALSEDSLGDWNRPEEDAAWASLQYGMSSPCRSRSRISPTPRDVLHSS